MDRRISATEAARELSDVLNRVKYQGVTFLIERGGEPVARLVPVGPVAFTGATVVSLLRELGRPDPGFADDLEAITRGQPTLEASSWEP